MALGICLLMRHTHAATVAAKQAEVSLETRRNVINTGVYKQNSMETPVLER